ncbi:MAG: peroxiredoxin [Bacteroidetes bacterium]|nr:MAG: peroxiredoxin [Bacteroidota bacterium]MBL1145087.1 peroxiredoxin [Bacteroidota bacterium]NOG57884.1 peroxiredoxin [Bacteroidota bacterium]
MMPKNTLSVGDKIPSFELLNQHGELIRISPDDGLKRIIYFYPKDNTKVCTEQACSFEEWQEDFAQKGFQVIGISSDSVHKHVDFSEKYNLTYELLSDVGGKVRKQFGAASFFGLIPMRITFVVDESGTIIYFFDALMEGEEHVNKVFEFLKKV